MKRCIAGAFLCLALLAPGSARAQASSPEPAISERPPAALHGARAPRTGPYTVLRVGAFVPTSKDLTDADFGTGMDFEAGLGMLLTPGIAAELAVGRLATSGEDHHYSPFFGQTYTTEIDAAVLTVSASLKGIVPVGKASLYALASVAFFAADFDWTERWQDGDVASGTTSDSPLGFQLGGGLAFPVSEKVLLGVEAKYAIVEFDLPDGKYDGNGVRIAGALGYRF